MKSRNSIILSVANKLVENYLIEMKVERLFPFVRQDSEEQRQGTVVILA